MRSLGRLSFLATAWVLFAGARLVSGQEDASPQPESPPKQGLPSRAIPALSLQDNTPDDTPIYTPLYRLTTPFYDNVFAVPEPEPPFLPDPSTYREVTAYEPPQGLLPLHPIPGLLTLKLVAGVAESYDSNIEQTATNHIGDFFTTLRLNTDIQLGSPDSLYSEGYDTILALKIHHEFWADIFSSQDQFNALNNRLQVESRIGRSDFIWRPFMTYEDITGSNLLTVERVGRTERDRLLAGVVGQYKLTSQLTWNQTFSHLSFSHPDSQFINFGVYRTYQEIAYRTFNDFDFFGWGEYRDTDPSRGSNGQETLGGFGWRGKPDPRLFSELLVGWDSVDLSGDQADRFDRSGLYISGHTSFEWSPRLRLVLKYDRNYTFNELTANDNYTNNTVQFAPEIFLGGNWYLTPYLGVSYNQFETSHDETLEIRPEVEVAYVLPNESRYFVKIGYDKTSTLKGGGGPIEIYRLSTGINWRF